MSGKSPVRTRKLCGVNAGPPTLADVKRAGLSGWHYVYALNDPRDGETFYVGRGRNGRVGNHEQEARRGVPGPKCDLIRAIHAAGLSVDKRIVALFRDKNRARAHERGVVATIGRGRLTNGEFRENRITL